MRRILFYYFYLFIVWGAYRYLTHYSEAFDEFVAKPLIWLIPIVYIVVLVEKRNLVHGIHLHFRSVIHDIFIGFAGSVFIFVVFIGSLYLKNYSLTFNPEQITFFTAISLLWIAFGTALVEEITFRGYIFSRLRRDRHYVHYANLLTAILFVGIHIPIVLFVDQSNAIDAMTRLLLLMELSLMDGYLFHARSGLIAPVVAHTTWSFLVLWVI